MASDRYTRLFGAAAVAAGIGFALTPAYAYAETGSDSDGGSSGVLGFVFRVQGRVRRHGPDKERISGRWVRGEPQSGPSRWSPTPGLPRPRRAEAEDDRPPRSQPAKPLRPAKTRQPEKPAKSSQRRKDAKARHTSAPDAHTRPKSRRNPLPPPPMRPCRSRTRDRHRRREDAGRQGDRQGDRADRCQCGGNRRQLTERVSTSDVALAKVATAHERLHRVGARQEPRRRDRADGAVVARAGRRGRRRRRRSRPCPPRGRC